MEQKMKEYAALLVRVGLNIQPGQTLIISSPTDCASFARLCATAAYDAGCREVVMSWHDDVLDRERYLRADDAVFDEVPEWRRHFYNDYAASGAAYLAIAADDPDSMRGVDATRINRSRLARDKYLDTFNRAQMNNVMPWCVASVPVKAWAEKVFPGEDTDTAMGKLWDAILETVRVDGSGNAVEAWQKHLAMLAERKDKLNALRLRSLHYTNSLGTDLTIELPEGHLWAAGSATTPGGQTFVANLPTEEIFTAPKRDGVNGVVCASLPLVVHGNVVEGIRFVVKDGKIVEATATRGEEFLRAAISVDEGASHFGEVALVPYDSPISNQGILYYNTLFDENARCHIAFGEAYPECIEGGEALSKDELLARGLNQSAMHEDFMVGTADLRITGTTCEGQEVPVFTDGNFAL